MKLTGSMFFFDIFLRHFRWMVDREVDWPVWVVSRSLSGPLCAVHGRSWGLCSRSGGGLGTYAGDIEPVLGLHGRSWAALGPHVSGLGCSWAALGAYVGDLGPLLGLYWRSWAALGPYVGGPGPLLAPMFGVLGSSWSLCWWSWAT